MGMNYAACYDENLEECCPTTFQAEFQETVIRWQYTMTILNCISETLVYLRTGWSVIAFAFPTLIAVPFYFKWGERRASYRAAMVDMTETAEIGLAEGTYSYAN